MDGGAADSNGVYVQFTPRQRDFVAIGIFLNVMCTVLNGSLVTVLILQRNKLLRDVNMLLTFNLNVADVLYGLPLVVFHVLKWISNDYSLLGPSGCNIEGAVICAASMWSVAALLWIGLERYELIVHERRRSNKFWMTAVAIGWLQGVILAVLPLIVPGSGYVVEPAGMYCSHSWGSKDSVRLSVILIVLGILCGVSNAIGMMYYRIYLKVQSVERESKEVLGGGSTVKSHVMSSGGQTTTAKNNGQTEAGSSDKAPSKGVHFESSKTVDRNKKQAASLERTILVKCITLTVAFFVSWVFCVIHIVLAIAGYVVPWWFDAVSAYFALMYSTFNWGCVVFLDQRIKAAMKEAVVSVLKRLRLCK
ncbi:hypothetical protein RI367_007719 [Sorochytrium milnesiophthora]